MTCIRKLAMATLVAGVASIGPVHAALSIVSSVGGAPTGVNRWNLDNPLSTPAGLTLTMTQDAGFVTGSQSGIYAAPFLSGGNGTGFGSPNQPNGVDTTQYLTTGSTSAYAQAAVELVFSTAQQYFGLLWGSVDSYNRLEFFIGNVSVGSLTGSAVTPAATGDQGTNGTFYVNINSDQAFDRVRFTSSQYAFEFDNLAWNDRPVGVPEPGALALLTVGVLGLAAAYRRRRA